MGASTVVLCGFWNYAWPAVPLGAFAIVGSAAFLASSMKMPVIAAVLIIEFTWVGHDFLIPILFGVVGSITAFSLCTQHIFQPAWRTPLRYPQLLVGNSLLHRSSIFELRSKALYHSSGQYSTRTQGLGFGELNSGVTVTSYKLIAPSQWLAGVIGEIGSHVLLCAQPMATASTPSPNISRPTH
jgi:hypothetical protein